MRHSVRLALALLALSICFFACREEHVATEGSRSALECPGDDPTILGKVAPFQFLAGDGRAVSEQALRGRVWIVDFFFTTCSGPCPRISEQMRALQDDLAGSDVLLVSISVDPSVDTVEVLHNYAERLGADPARWWFLTGDEASTFDLIRSSFALPVERVNDALLGFQVSHATKLVVVDQQGRVRGYYAGETPEGRAMAHERALWLAAHPGS
jgi:cytochrome oxidase Cu insertion factor (SCO1/SenC/PrrC family)